MKLPLLNFTSKKEKTKKNTLISSLAPKVLTKKEDIEKIQPYLDKLNETIHTKGISNIALTGGYGSGKSTVIKTFQHLNTQYKYLNISLASFNKKKDDEDDKVTPIDKKTQKEELERLLEVSILQQIFYHVKPKEIPESRFKRIINIPNWKIWLITICFIIWVICSVLLLKYDYLDKVNPHNWIKENDLDLLSLIIIVISFSGLGILSKLIINLFRNSKINKVNIKGELELGDNVNKSVFNEHLEEILYFFERTKFNVVIIEDLDRFDSTDIFTKLREINILLNNSKLINREINFVYAVGDDLFGDKKERVKFFEYIIPVIPFINSSNANEQLRTLIKESGLDENIFTKEFISDVTTFIDDIDMRLLTNIFHEFVIYRKTLKPEFIKKNDELFAMITYKNIDPKDFTLLNRKEGKLYELINNKKTYVKESISKIDEKIQSKSSEIKKIEKETITDIKELRSIYVSRVLFKLPNNAVLENSSLKRLVEDDGFENILNEDIKYNTYNNYNGYYFTQVSNQQLKYSFSDIEKDINPDYTYEERVKLVESKHNNEIDLLKNEIEKLRKKKSEIENQDLKQIFNEVDVNQYLDDFSNNNLLRNLILNGYINENYNDYISLFHEVSITKEDFVFERNVKSGYAKEFNYKLSDKIENLIDKIDERYFEREAILNFDLLDYLGNNYNKYSNKYDSIIRLLSNEKEKSVQFIDEYIKDEQRPLVIFIEKLVENWKGFWEFIYYKSTYEEETIYNYLRIIITYASKETITNNQHNKALYEAISTNSKFLSLIEEKEGKNYFGKISYIIKQLNIKFDSLEVPDEKTNSLFDYVYNNNHYEINEDNISLMIKEYGKTTTDEQLKTSNYTTILSSSFEPIKNYIHSEINTYVNNVFLKIPENISETEDSLILLLNNTDLKENLKIKIIQKVETKITDLKKIKELEIKTQLLINNKVVPKWNNVIDYYTTSENTINDNLIKFLNFENVYLELSEEKMIFKSESFNYASFRENLLLCNEISSESYRNIFKSSIYTRDVLSFENLDEDKITYLIDKILTTTKSNYDLLREYFPNNHISLIEKDFPKFIGNINDFETDEEDILLLLKSNKISIDNKFKYISLLEEKIIVDNTEISKVVVEIILQKSTTIEFEYNTIESLVKTSNPKENKVKLINLYSKDLDDNQLMKITSLVGWEYEKMFKKRKRPTFDITDYNKALFNTLKSKGLIKDFSVDKKENSQFRVIANY